MALDFCILGASGVPEIMVSLDPEAHNELMARSTGLPLLARSADYYEDAEYAPDEVGGLLGELVSLGPVSGETAELVALCAEAMRRGSGIITIAD